MSIVLSELLVSSPTAASHGIATTKPGFPELNQFLKPEVHRVFCLPGLKLGSDLTSCFFPLYICTQRIQGASLLFPYLVQQQWAL